MLLLFAVGMNLAWIALLAGIVLLEKLGPPLARQSPDRGRATALLPIR